MLTILGLDPQSTLEVPHGGERIPQLEVQRALISADADFGNATSHLLKRHISVCLAKTVGRCQERHAAVRLASGRAAEADCLRARSIHFESHQREFSECPLILRLTDDKHSPRKRSKYEQDRS